MDGAGDTGEVRLYCYSEERAEKERGIVERFATSLERDLNALHEGLSRPRTQKKPDRIWQRIGRMQERSRGAGQHYDIEVTADESGEQAVAVTWTRKPVDGSMTTHPGIYCLRSNETDWSEETLWRTYTLLTDLEAVFRSLESEQSSELARRLRSAPMSYQIVLDGLPRHTDKPRAWHTRSAAHRWARRRSDQAITRSCDQPDCAPRT